MYLHIFQTSKLYGGMKLKSMHIIDVDKWFEIRIELDKRAIKL